MSPDTVLFIIRALVRVGSATTAAIEQKIRDEELRVPDMELLDLDDFTLMLQLFRDREGSLRARVENGGDLAPYWDWSGHSGDGGPSDKPDATEVLMDAARQYLQGEVDKPATFQSRSELQAARGSNILKQWAEGEGPPPPAARIALSLASVALDYVQVNPALLGIGGQGEKLIRALAEKIQKLLPDADDPKDWQDADWNRYYFAERTLSLLLHAGLKTLNEHPDLVFGEKHLQLLVENTTEPLVKLFEEDKSGQFDLLKLQETLLGPVAEAALGTLAKHQRAFLGRRFDPEKAVGAVTAAVFEVVREKDLRQVFDDDTIIIDLTAAVLNVAAGRPELILGDDGSPAGDLARGLLGNVSAAVRDIIKDDNKPVSDGLVVDIAVAVLEAVHEHGPGFFDKNEPWENVAASTIGFITDGLVEGLQEEGLRGFESLFSRAQAMELVRIVLAQAARTPGMLTTDSARAEIRQLVSAIAAAMSADKKLLLAPEDWHRIAAVVASEAARNPGRLFELDAQKPEEHLATLLIQRILQAAAEDFEKRGRSKGSLGFGEVLADAIEITFRAAAGNIAGAMSAVGLELVDGKALDNLGELVRKLNEASSENPDQIGWREWRWLFEQVIIDAIDDGGEFSIDVEYLLKLLNSGQPQRQPGVAAGGSSP